MNYVDRVCEECGIRFKNIPNNLYLPEIVYCLECIESIRVKFVKDKGGLYEEMLFEMRETG